MTQNWVKQLQYRCKRQNLMLLAWNACSSILKQNGCKNKTTWLTQTALSKFFPLFHITYIEDIKRFLMDFWKDFSSFKTYFILKDLVTQSFLNFPKKCRIEDCEWPERRITCGMKDREWLSWLKNAEFKFTN